MGILTISIDDEVERKFRDRVRQVSGERKGALGKAATEAISRWVTEQSQQEIAKKALALMERGYDLGARQYRTRDDLHERSTGPY
jgi:site-specific recombinase XerC